MNVQVGDTVKVWKWVYDREYGDTGIVEQVIDDNRGRSIKVNGDWYQATNDDMNKCKVVRTGEKHIHAPQKLEWGGTLYICVCGARQQKSKIVDGKKVEVWKMESAKEQAAREHAIEMLQTEGYGYDGNQSDAEDQYDGGRGAGSLGQPID
jgi:hypothetical protein